MRPSRLLPVLFVGLVLSGCVDQPASDASGEEIFLEVCARCHAPDLSGGVGPSLGPSSEAADQSDEFLFTAIHDGRGRMPSFAQSLTDEQINRVIDHLRSVQAAS